MKPDAAAQTEKLLATLWTKNLPVIRGRVEMLEHAAETARSAALTSLLRRDAAMTAHKLAGSLGMFGYPEGTQLARKLELLFDGPAEPSAAQLAELSACLRRSLNL